MLAVPLLGCGSETPTPHYVAQPTSALVHVRTAPPPARVEIVPPQPARGAVWIDGEWAWRGRKWAWRRGRWVKAPAGASYSPWTFTRDLSGEVWFAAGTWRSVRGVAVAEPEPLAVAAAGHGDVTDSNGEKEDTGNARDGRRGKGPRQQPPDATEGAPSAAPDDSADAGAPR